jgi:hypothetical protein
MPDPISVISATTLALHAAKRAYEFVEGIVDAPNAIGFLQRDLNALQSVLAVLDSRVRDPAFAHNPRSIQIVAIIQKPLQGCSEDCQRVIKMLHPFIRSSVGAKTGRWRSMAFGFREKEMRSLQQDLVSSKTTLEVGISLANLYVMFRLTSLLC